MPATKNLFKVSIVRYHLIYCSHVIADFEQFFVDWWLTVGKNLLKVSIITAEPRSSDCCSYIIMLTLSRFLLTVFYCSIGLFVEQQYTCATVPEELKRGLYVVVFKNTFQMAFFHISYVVSDRYFVRRIFSWYH